MGRKTWESLPIKPLPNRINCVISSTLTDDRCKVFRSITEFQKEYDNFIVIGGISLCKHFLPVCDVLYVTEILKEYPADIHFPEIPDYFRLVETIENKTCNFKKYINYGTKQNSIQF